MEAVLWQCTAGSARAFYTPDRQVAKVDLPLTYFSKWEEFRILVLLTIFGETKTESRETKTETMVNIFVYRHHGQPLR